MAETVEPIRFQFFRAVAVDYDFTLTGSDESAALDALAGARRAGLKVVLVTGRILSELRGELPDVDRRFDAIVGENGGVLAIDGRVRLLAQPIDVELGESLAIRGVPVRRGSVLIATDAVHDVAVLEESRRLGLDVQLVRNRAALMVLPPGVGKGHGVHHALGELGVSFHNTVGIGDAENDFSLIDGCEVGVAVANAVDSLKRHADLVLAEPDGRGVAGLLGRLRSGELILHPRRWQVELGTATDGGRVLVPASQVNILISGSSGGGKSYLAGLMAERLLSLQYSICVLDPEGDHVALGRYDGVVVLGGSERPPPPAQLRTFIRHRFGSVVVDLSQLSVDDKRAYLSDALAELGRLRDDIGLPHWIILDEAHVPIGTDGLLRRLVEDGSRGCCLVTYRPADLPDSMRAAVDLEILVAGSDGNATLRSRTDRVERGFTVDLRRTAHVRHWHKYIEAHLPPHQRFAFRTSSAPTGHYAGNVDELYREIDRCASGVVRHHLGHGDFARWTRTSLQDPILAAAIERVEARARAGEEVESLRASLLAAIAERYRIEPAPRRRFEEHPSEVELRLEAATLPTLFEEAARALAELMAGPVAADTAKPESVTVRGRDLESLLVAWLNELIFRADAHQRVYPVVQLDTLSDHELTATVCGSTPPVSRTAVKAATLHRLRVGERAGGGYEARVVLDV